MVAADHEYPFSVKNRSIRFDENFAIDFYLGDSIFTISTYFMAWGITYFTYFFQYQLIYIYIYNYIL